MGVCVVFGCKNRTDRGHKKQHFGFHRFPKNKALRKQWIKAIRRKDWEPSATSLVCTEHFSENDVNRTYPSGPKLRENAVPTIFPAYAKHLKKVVKVGYLLQVNLDKSKLKNRKVDDRKKLKTNAVSTIFNRSYRMNTDSSESGTDESDSIDSTVDTLTIDKLSETVPYMFDDEFSFSQFNDNMIIQKWNSKFDVLYQLVIKKDLEILATIYDVPVAINVQNRPMTRISQLNDIGEALRYLEETKTCQNYKRPNRKCRGFLRPNENRLCSGCSKEKLRTSNKAKLGKAVFTRSRKKR